MNKTILSGRLTKDPETRYTQAAEPMAVSRYTLAVDRPGKKDGQQNADFISCVAFGKNGQFAEKYLKKGTKIIVEGHIQTGSFTNKEGKKVYTTDVVVDRQEFCEGKREETHESAPEPADDFMAVPDAIQEELPFV